MRYLYVMAFVLCVPVYAHAAVILTEIMYAPEGADADREWVEVCNTGSSTEDLSAWKFVENDVNHGLILAVGESALSSGSCAIIADDVDSFTAEHTSFSGTIFDSSFSLNNTGETLSLKDDDGTIVDTVTYSDTYGAEDDGNSLHRDGSSWTANTPTPGVSTTVTDSSHESTSSSSDSTSAVVSSQTLYSYESVTIEPPQDVYVRVPTQIETTVGAFTRFEMESYDATGSAITHGKVRWSFGDGGSAVGRVVSHRFVYPGTYTATVRLDAGPLFDTQTITVYVEPLSVALYADSEEDWIEIVNTGAYTLDVSQWRLLSAGRYFRIPDGSIIGSQMRMRLPRDITQLSIRELSDVRLVYPDGEIVAHAHAEEVSEAVDEVVIPDSVVAPSVPQAPSIPVAVVEAEPRNMVPEVVEARVSTTTASTTVLLAGVQHATRTNDTMRLITYFGIAAIAVWVLSLVLFTQRTVSRVRGFEIVERTQ